MKKVISGALAAAIITSNLPLRVLAEEINPIVDSTDSTVEQEKTRTGYIEVDINLDMPINYKKSKKNVGINVKLSEVGSENEGNKEIHSINLDESKTVGDITVKALSYNKKTEVEDGGKIYAYRVIFNNLKAAEDKLYNVNISGDGFKGKVGNIELNNVSKRVIVNNLYNNESNENMLFGDVDKNGSINDDDYNAVFNNIGTEKKEYDLNRDGKVDITDLTYVHKNLGKNQAEELEVKDTEPIIDLSETKIEPLDNTTIHGNINDILTDSDNVLQIKKSENSSEEEALKVKLDIVGADSKPVPMETIRIQGGEKAPTKGFVHIKGIKDSVSYEDTIYFGDNNAENKVYKIHKSNSIKENNNIVINLGQQIAVSEITITITASTGNDRNLAEIAKVEFLNDVYKEIPKPDMDIPKVDKVETSTATGSEHMTIHWNQETNITGYEVKIEEIDANGKVSGNAKVFRTSENFFKYSAVKAYRRYRVSIQSVNGEWESGYNKLSNDESKGIIDNIDPTTMGDENGVGATYSPKNIEDDNGIVNIMVVPNDKPEPPEGIKAKGQYKYIEVSWKNHSSAREFDVYYRKLKTNDEDEISTKFTKANTETIKNKTSYTIEGLDESASYEIKLTATNHKGTSKMSEGVIATTLNMTVPESPNYRLINTPNGVNKLTNHITSVEFPTVNNAQTDVTITDEDCVVDNDYSTIWNLNHWDSGAAYDSNRGPIVNFDKEYAINRVAVIRRLDKNEPGVYTGGLRIFNNKTGKWEKHKANVQTKGKYILLELDKPVVSDKVQVNLATYTSEQNPGHFSIAELKFYEYADVEGDVKNLFSDNLHLVLRKNEEGKVDVTQDEIDRIRRELNTPDPSSGEYHIRKDALLKEVEIAEQILHDKEISEKVIDIDPLINNFGAKTGYGNDWQALGFSAKAGDEINIYLAQNESKKIVLGYEQHYAESSSYINQEITLKPGKNTVTLKALTDKNVEKGGNLYVRVDNEKGGESPYAKIQVRVSGATEIPHLNLNNSLKEVDSLVNEENSEEVAKIKEKLELYIEKLEKHVKEMPSKYKANATEYDNVNNIYSYDEKTSILNSTNIEGDRFTLTLPAKDVYEGITEGTNGDRTKQVENLYNTVLAWEQIIQITNAKKGVFEKVADFNNDGKIDSNDSKMDIYKNNKASQQRVNVKYQRMFIGAFMYASGHHVGIDVGSSKDLMKGVPFKFDKNGHVTNPDEARLFGWGISHEIGHKADIGDRTYSETSNNILSLITQTFDGKDKSRLEENGIYSKIYKKVTSSSVGVSQDAATLLGMFWQLQLAYEPGYTSEMLKRNNDGDLTNDSYYAKMNRLYRSLTDAEKALDKDQLLIRKASEAAGKDLRGFFKSWGLIADDNTKIYLQNLLEKEEIKEETKKIQYLNDEAYRKRLTNDASALDMSKNLKVKASFEDVEKGNKVDDASIVNNNSIKINIDLPDEFKGDKDKILGYEIIRSDGNTLTEVKDESTDTKPDVDNSEGDNSNGNTDDNTSTVRTTNNEESGESNNNGNDGSTEETIPNDSDKNETTSDKKYKTEILYRPVGFVNAEEDGHAIFIDDISPINNRVMTYKIVAYDYNLNATKEIPIGSVKFSHDGSIDISNFDIKSNLTSLSKEESEKSSNKNENTVVDNGLDAIKDKNLATSFKGRKITKDEYDNNPHKQEGINIEEDPYIVIDLQGSRNISGLKYTKSSDAVSRFSLKRLVNAVKGETTYNPISEYEIYISDNNKDWKKVSDGEFKFGNSSIIDGESDKNTAKVLFGTASNVYAYDTKYIKLVAPKATNVDIAEISLIGSTGDNIEIGAINETDNTRTNGIGKLTEDFNYAEGKTIPKGSIIVTGEYKGNPAYNIPLLIDENNTTIKGKIILMASVNKEENSLVGNVASGKWIYWTSPENFEKLSKKVKAELYRYNNLNASGAPEGQRLVSDTLYVNITKNSYDELDGIKFSNAGTTFRTKSYDIVKVIDTKDYIIKEDK